MTVKSQSVRFYWVVCSAPGCLNRAPSDRDEQPAHEDRELALDVAHDEGWVITPNGGEHYCPDHADELCVVCSRFVGRSITQWRGVCVFCQAAGRGGLAEVEPPVIEVLRDMGRAVTTAFGRIADNLPGAPTQSDYVLVPAPEVPTFEVPPVVTAHYPTGYRVETLSVPLLESPAESPAEGDDDSPDRLLAVVLCIVLGLLIAGALLWGLL